MKTTDQLNPNTYTARERAIARAAFLDGVATCWHKGALGEPARLARWHDASLGAAAAKYEKKARAAFPAPPVTRPRVIVDRVASVAYRYVDGLLQQTNNVNDPHGANVRWITAIAIFARMIDQINALAADPTETVTDDEDGG